MKMKLGKRIAAFALGTLMLAAFAGCSTSGSGSSGSASTGDSGKIQIQFWHSMSGNTQEALDEVVAGFNESQDTYEVVATNQGSYDESTGKFFNMANGDGSAHIIQIGEQNLQSMIDSGMVASVSDLIEKHSFDDSDLLEPGSELLHRGRGYVGHAFQLFHPRGVLQQDRLCRGWCDGIPHNL